MTINSVLVLFFDFEWKNFPKIGTSPMKGILLKVSVSRLSSRPPIAKLWPSPNSTSVFTFRTETPGTVNPWMVIPLA